MICHKTETTKNQLLAKKCYEKELPTMLEGKDVTLHKGFMRYTNFPIQANRSNFIMKDLKKSSFLDMAIASDKNIPLKEFDKLPKYKDLEIEVARMWHLNTSSIFIVIGTQGMIKKNTDKQIRKTKKIHLHPNHESTAHILRTNVPV